MEPDQLLTVTQRRGVAEGIVELTLATSTGEPLPDWSPGAHIDLDLGPGLVRQYSLCSDPADLSHWRVAVLREENGRGGSARIHDTLHVGKTVRTRGPRNHFELRSAPHTVFIAGGIGITPIMTMVAELERRDAGWELHYGGRKRESMAYVSQLADCHPDRVHLYCEAEVGLIDLEAVLGAPRPDTLVYCCGPEALLNAVEQRCASWPRGSLRIERFAPVSPATSPDADTAFEVVFKQSDVTAIVEPGTSIVEIAEAHEIDVMTSCAEGVCGTCETPVIDGDVDHRDSVLTDEDRAAGNTMMICVSRCRSARLVLDL